MELTAHIAELRRALEEAEAEAHLFVGAALPAAHRPERFIVRAEIQTPTYLGIDPVVGVLVLPAGAGGPRARPRSLGCISVVFVAK